MKIEHVFISPHLDDAVLSCGGTIAHLVEQQTPVKIISLFAGIPEATAPLSDFARAQHYQWGTRQNAYVTRRAEDQIALACFNLLPVWLPFPDCIYRVDAQTGYWYYTADADIFGPLSPAELETMPQLLAKAIEKNVSGKAIFYFPLATGNHVDHQLALLAAHFLQNQEYSFCFYPDYPYSQRHPADLPRALETCRQQLFHYSAGTWRSEIVYLSAINLQTKLNAIAAYQSQLPTLFGGLQPMIDLVTAYTLQTGQGQPAEIFWTWNDDNS